MKRPLLIWGATAVATAVVVHLAAVSVYPRVIMNAALDRLSRDGAAVNTWLHAPRMTEDWRTIVRPSPDIAYSSCVYDLADGPVRIHVEPWQDYMSLSLFDANTDNFYTLNDQRMPATGADVIIYQRGAEPSRADADAAFEVVETTSRRGVALIRRLAPTQERFALANAARGREICAPVGSPE